MPRHSGQWPLSARGGGRSPSLRRPDPATNRLTPQVHPALLASAAATAEAVLGVAAETRRPVSENGCQLFPDGCWMRPGQSPPLRFLGPGSRSGRGAARPLPGVWAALRVGSPRATDVSPWRRTDSWALLSESVCLPPSSCRPRVGSLSLAPRSGPAPPLPARGRAWAPPLPLAPAACP